MKSQKSLYSLKHLLIYGLVVVLIGATIFGVLRIVRHKKPPAVIIPSHSVATSQPSSSSSKQAPSASGYSSNSSTKSSNPNILIKPFGTFVSNHHPGIDGSPTTEQSTCNTAPGASCSIIFTKGNETRQLGTKTADASGLVIWNWDVKDAGFSTGSWQILAIASLNGQSQTAQDATNLEIQ